MQKQTFKFQNNKECIVCKTTDSLHLHHIYFGVKNRKVSDKNGFTCYLCQMHHEGLFGVHGKFGHDLDMTLKKLCQEKYEETHTREDFVSKIGKSYL